MDSHGEGSISEFLMILGPCAQLADDENRMREESLNAQATWSSTVESERPPGVNADSLVAWGVDGNADILCWSRRGDGPHEWPVVVYRRQKGPAWRVYDIGMADFLVALFDGAFSENPMSGAELWRRENIDFLARKRRRWLSRPGSIRGRERRILTPGCSGRGRNGSRRGTDRSRQRAGRLGGHGGRISPASGWPRRVIPARNAGRGFPGGAAAR